MPTWNYTTGLNLLFMALVAVLVVRFIRTGGRQMLEMMDTVPEGGDSDESHAHSH